MAVQFSVNLKGDCGNVDQDHPKFNKAVQIQIIAVDKGSQPCVAFFNEKSPNGWKCLPGSLSRVQLSDDLALYKGETDHFT